MGIGGGGGTPILPTAFAVTILRADGTQQILNVAADSFRTYRTGRAEMEVRQYNVERFPPMPTFALAVNRGTQLNGAAEEFTRHILQVASRNEAQPDRSQWRCFWPVTRALVSDNDGSVRPRGRFGALRLLTYAQAPTTTVVAVAYGDKT